MTRFDSDMTLCYNSFAVNPTVNEMESEMTSRREFYRRTEATWPENVPAVSAAELVKAARKLYRFVRRKRCDLPVKVSSGNRYPYIWRGVIVVNPEKGWKHNVHGLSHALGGGHSKSHARLEARMIREVLKRGWLDGALKAPEKPEPTVTDIASRKLASIEARIKRWESKQKRAVTAIRKLRRSHTYYSNKVAA